MSAETSSQTLGEIATETGTTDDITRPKRSPETVDRAHNSNGDVLLLQACPNPDCDADFYSQQEVKDHLLAVGPAHVGLTPLWDGDAE
jgi:hypothetical protein